MFPRLKKASSIKLLVGIWLLAQPVLAQISPPNIQWQHLIGETNAAIRSFRQTSDGGFLLVGGSAEETNSYKTGPHYGSFDGWVIKLDSSGNKIWDKTFGGTGDDRIVSFELLPDEGMLLNISSYNSSGGNKTATNFGSTDIWLVRLDAQGNKLWERSFGGTNNYDSGTVLSMPGGGFILYGVIETGYQVMRLNAVGEVIWARPTESVKACVPLRDGGVLLGGVSYASLTNYGDFDLWAARLDTNGNTVWEGSFGGTGAEAFSSMVVLPDEGVLLSGYSLSSPGRSKVAPLYGKRDIWLVRLDPGGVKLWDRSYGGTDEEEPRQTVLLGDGGFAVVGHSYSGANGNKTSLNYGGADVWVLRLDASGNILWERAYGGARTDWPVFAPNLVLSPDTNLLLAVSSSSGIGGVKTTPGYGADDVWLFRVDANGNKLWELTQGGNGADGSFGFQQTPDGGHVLGLSRQKLSRCSLIKFGPEPAVLRPRVQSSGSVGTNGFQFSLEGVAGRYVLECSTNLEVWAAIQTNQVSATGQGVEVTAPAIGDRSKAFYRARYQP